MLVAKNKTDRENIKEAFGYDRNLNNRKFVFIRC